MNTDNSLIRTSLASAESLTTDMTSEMTVTIKLKQTRACNISGKPHHTDESLDETAAPFT
jgi:hypothetical protein